MTSGHAGAPAETQAIRCPSCAAPQPLPSLGNSFLRCAHCGTAAYFDASGLRRHFITEPVLSRSAVAAAVRSAHAGDPLRIELTYHPFWEFAAAGRALALDARPDTPPELPVLPLTSGSRRPSGTAPTTLDPPTLLPGPAAAEASERLRTTVHEHSATLVHHPVFRVATRAGATIWIDGVEGGILASENVAARSGGTRFPLIALLAGALAAALLPFPIAFALGAGVAGWPIFAHALRSRS